MPTRRGFLGYSVAVGATLALPDWLCADEPVKNPVNERIATIAAAVLEYEGIASVTTPAPQRRDARSRPLGMGALQPLPLLAEI